MKNDFFINDWCSVIDFENVWYTIQFFPSSILIPPYKYIILLTSFMSFKMIK